MSRRFGVDRKLMTYRQVAEQGFGKPVAWLYRHMAELQEQGFPKPLIGRQFDPAAIDAWLNGRIPREKIEGKTEISITVDPLESDQEILGKRLLEMQYGGRA